MNGQDVISFRERRHYSRQVLAELAGLTPGKIWRIEHKGVIHADEREKLLALGVMEIDASPGAPTDLMAALKDSLERAKDARDVVSAVIVDEEPPTVDFASALERTASNYKHFFSNSELRTFKRCRRKWYLGWVRGLRPVRESPVGVRQIGDRLHRALQRHYQPGGPSSPTILLDELERQIQLDRSRMGLVSADVADQFEKEANLERIMLEGYIEWITTTGVDSELEVVSSEAYLEVPLPEFNDEYALIGKIDVRVRRTIDGVRMFLDHKSVASLTEPTLTLALDEQMLHYHLLESMSDELDRCDGALYNMLRRVKRTARAVPPFFSRIEVRHNQHELDSYRRRVVNEIIDMQDVRRGIEMGADHRAVAYPNPTRDCTWDCPFLAVCPMFDDGSRAEAMIDQYFIVTDPLTYYLREVLEVE